MYTLAELAQLIDAELVGDPQAVARRAQSFEAAGDGDVTFAGTAAYRARLAETAAAAVIVAPPLVDRGRVNLLVTARPKLAFARAVQALHERAYTPTGISDDLRSGEGCVLGENLSVHARVTLGREVILGDRVTLHPGVVIGDRSRVGDDTTLFANVSVYEDCEIGRRVTIHAGAVIGGDGFGFVPDEEGKQVKLLQLGRVIVEDDCEIGANCALDRGGFADTILRRGVKLDNLIQVGHNSEIGEHTVVAALTGFSGGTRIGRRCIIAGQVGTREHVTVGDRATLMGRAVITKHVPAGAAVVGMATAMEVNAWRRSQAVYARLPEVLKRLQQLEKTVKAALDHVTDHVVDHVGDQGE